MNKLKTLLAAAALSFVGTTANAAVILTVESAGQMTTTQTGVTTVDFDDNTIGAYTEVAGKTDYTIYGAAISGQTAPPYGVTTNYLSVPNPESSGIAAFGIGGYANYFGLFWGSIDAYNTLSFWKAGALVESFTGTQVSPLVGNGNQTSDSSNRYINFFFDGGGFDQVRLESTQFAFETDNHSFGVVPEPSAIALFGLGILGLGFAVRRKRS
jgi:hypothetical protein